MRTRDEAITALVKRGYVARARDWALGESICVAKRLVHDRSGIAMFEPTAIYLYPLDGNRWASTRGGIGIADAQFDDLEDAIEFAVACLEIADWRSDRTST